MKFDVLDLIDSRSLLSGVTVWGARDGECSYVISFDGRHPDLGYAATWSLIGNAERNSLGRFGSFAAAKAACEDVRRKRKN